MKKIFAKYLNNYSNAGLWYIGSSILTKVFAFLSVAVLTRIMTTSDYGDFSLFMSWVNIVTIVIGLSFSSTVGIAKRDFKNNYKEYLSSIVVYTLLLLMLWIVILFIFQNPITNIIGFDKSISLLIILHSYNLFIIMTYQSILNFSFEYKKSSLILFVSSLLGEILSIVLILMNPNSGFYFAVYGIFISSTIFSICILFKIIMKAAPKFKYNYLKYALYFSIPMIFHNLALVLLNQIDRIMIDKLIGSVEVAVYSVVYSLSVVASILWTAVLKIWKPWLYERLNNNERDKVIQSIKIIINIFVIIIVNYIIISPEILYIFVPKEYHIGADFMGIIIFGYYFSFLFSLYVNFEYYHGKTLLIFVGTIMATIINVILNYFGLIYFGYFAAAYTTLISYFVLFLYHFFMNRRNDYLPKTNIVFTIIFLLLVTVFNFFMMDHFILKYGFLIVLNIIMVFYTLKMAKKFSNTDKI